MRIGVLLSLVLAAGFVGDSVRQSLTAPFILRLSESQSTLHPTAGPNNMSNCLLVMPNGHVHLELRRQEFFDGTAMLGTYESALDSKEIGILRSILDDAEVRALHRSAGPVLPMDVDDWQAFRADIMRGVKVQQVGYVSWHGHGPNNSEADKTAWKQATVTLQRLVEWSHAVKSSKSLNWRRVRNPSNVCMDRLVKDRYVAR
jgi:hypothetical protein